MGVFFGGEGGKGMGGGWVVMVCKGNMVQSSWCIFSAHLLILIWSILCGAIFCIYSTLQHKQLDFWSILGISRGLDSARCQLSVVGAE